MPDKISHQDLCKVYTWDEVGLELKEFRVNIPDGATPRQALVLADDEISQQLGLGADEMGTYNKKVRKVGDVFVLDALFGRGMVTRLYYCPEGDAAQAKKLAKKELKKQGG